MLFNSAAFTSPSLCGPLLRCRLTISASRNSASGSFSVAPLIDILCGDERIHHQHRHAERPGDTRHPAANVAIPHQPQRFIAQFTAFKHFIGAFRAHVPDHIPPQTLLGGGGGIVSLREFPASAPHEIAEYGAPG